MQRRNLVHTPQQRFLKRDFPCCVEVTAHRRAAVRDTMASAKAAAPDPVPGTGSLRGLTSMPRFGAWAPPTMPEASEEQHAADRVRVQPGPYIFNGLQDR